MKQTLFFISHEFAGLPVFGFGWLLLIWLACSLASLAWLVRKNGWNDENRGFLPFIGIVALVIAFVLPKVLVAHRGLPIRGYGVMLLIAFVMGVLLAIRRGKQVGLPSDVIVSLAFHMFLGGIVGARLFFVIQYWHEIHDAGSLIGTVWNMVNFVEGGLVVYGALIGALTAGLWCVHKQQLPPLAVGDLIAPSLALGLAIGRIGCLLNGCCYGGLCEHSWAITFPRYSTPRISVEDSHAEVESPPYADQHRSGLLYGFQIGRNEQGLPVVSFVDPEGAAAASHVPEQAVVQAINGHAVTTMEEARFFLGQSDDQVSLSTDQGSYHWSMGALPKRSLPVHPTQIYSSINAVILCLITYAFFPFRRRDGEVLALLLGLYAITRFMLEVIRSDEGSLWSTGMTISQNVSIAMLVGVAGLFVVLSRQPRRSFWPVPADS